MKKTVVALGLVAILLLGMTYVYAQNPDFGRREKGISGQDCGFGKELSLTPEQKTKFQELRRAFRKENAKLIGEIVTKRLELQSLWNDPKADSKAIMSKERELKNLQNQMSEKMVQNRLEARSLLTPEQITEMGPMDGMGDHMGRAFKMGHGRRMGCFGEGHEMEP